MAAGVIIGQSPSSTLPVSSLSLLKSSSITCRKGEEELPGFDWKGITAAAMSEECGLYNCWMRDDGTNSSFNLIDNSPPAA